MTDIFPIDVLGTIEAFINRLHPNHQQIFNNAINKYELFTMKHKYRTYKNFSTGLTTFARFFLQNTIKDGEIYIEDVNNQTLVYEVLRKFIALKKVHNEHCRREFSMTIGDMYECYMNYMSIKDDAPNADHDDVYFNGMYIIFIIICFNIFFFH